MHIVINSLTYGNNAINNISNDYGNYNNNHCI